MMKILFLSSLMLVSMMVMTGCTDVAAGKGKLKEAAERACGQSRPLGVIGEEGRWSVACEDESRHDISVEQASDAVAAGEFVYVIGAFNE